MFKRLIIEFLIFVNLFYAQDTTQSLAFKKNRTIDRNPIFIRPDLSYQLVQQFKLIQQANSGDPLAQHELGLRLLIGDGFPADTLSGIYWIKKAATQNLNAAKYNYGLILLNGIGIEWNPFEAFEFFRDAAYKDFAPAQYIFGIIHIENLIIPQNLKAAFYWIYRAYKNGYKVDEKIFQFFNQKLPISYIDSVKNNQIYFSNIQKSSSYYSNDETFASSRKEINNLSFIDFDLVESDFRVSESDLIDDIVNKFLERDTNNYDSIKNTDALLKILSLEKLQELTNYDVPEILTLFGYLHLKGNILEKDINKALEYLLRATRYDSPKAPILIYETIKDKSVINSLKSQLQNKNNSVKFIWYGLIRFGFINDIFIKDAYDLLSDAAKDGYINAINELALNYYIGNYFQKDRDKAIQLWKIAEKKGSKEAGLRIILSTIFDEEKNISKDIVDSIFNFQKYGSILSQVALGFCYEKGRGVDYNRSNAIRFYTKAAQRGSRFAYERIRKIYDSIRPNKKEFHVE